MVVCVLYVDYVLVVDDFDFVCWKDCCEWFVGVFVVCVSRYIVDFYVDLVCIFIVVGEVLLF